MGRRPGRFGTEHALIRRFDEADLPDFGELLAGRGERGVLVCTAFQLHSWYPAAGREVHGTMVTPYAHDVQVQPVGPKIAGDDPCARRLSIRTGLGQADPAKLREMIAALIHADIITGAGPEPSR